MRHSICGIVGVALILAAAPAQAGDIHWGYDGKDGAAGWAALSPDFGPCASGHDQSPIDLSAAVPADAGAATTDWTPGPLALLNNGHTIQVNVAPGSAMTVAGARYQLLQYHLHHPSEHTIDGVHHPLEIHFVHRNDAGRLAVLGVMMKAGAANPELEKILAAMPDKPAPEAAVAGVTVDPRGMLPKTGGFFRYSGSLTTPPCSEGVLWTVLATPVEASAEQIDRFARLFPLNARPVQPLHTRFILQAK